jgi:hypothetical protein
MNHYQKDKSFDERKKESKIAMEKHPNNVPVYVMSKSINIKKSKYLIPKNMSVLRLVSTLRTKHELKGHEAMYLYFENSKSPNKQLILPVTSRVMFEAYEDYADEDGFLYAFIEREATFG